jgi:hypothetical protein
VVPIPPARETPLRPRIGSTRSLLCVFARQSDFGPAGLTGLSYQAATSGCEGYHRERLHIQSSPRPDTRVSRRTVQTTTSPRSSAVGWLDQLPARTHQERLGPATI